LKDHFDEENHDEEPFKIDEDILALQQQLSVTKTLSFGDSSS